jgi:hypothetical protein
VIDCHTCGIAVDYEESFSRNSRRWRGCFACAAAGDGLGGLGLAVRRFLRRAEVQALAQETRTMHVGMADLTADQATEYRPKHRVAMRDAYRAYRERFDNAIDRLAALAMEEH